MTNVCKHGRLARKCPDCECMSLEDEITLLEQELASSRERVKALEDSLRPIVEDAKRPFHFSTDGVVPVMYKYIHSAAAVLEQS